MKKLICLWVALCGLLLIPGNMKGQSSTSSSSLKSSITSALKSAVTSATGGSSVSAESLEGTWTYTNPAVQMESDNTLKSVAGSVVTSGVEEKLQEYCSKVGIEEGSFNYVFSSDGSFTSTVNSKTLKGTYTVDTDESTVTFNYTLGSSSVSLKNLTASVVLSGSDLTLLFDADKLMSLLSTISSITNSSTLSALNSLVEEYDGMMVGFDFSK